MTTLTAGGLRSAMRNSSPALRAPGLLARMGERWRYWQAERAMESLDDAALHDIGVARSEIADAVRTGRRTGR